MLCNYCILHRDHRILLGLMIDEQKLNRVGEVSIRIKSSHDKMYPSWLLPTFTDTTLQTNTLRERISEIMRNNKLPIDSGSESGLSQTSLFVLPDVSDDEM